MRILITGASGLLGLNLALEAVPDHQVFGVTHSTPLKTNAFTVLSANLLEPGALEYILEQAQPDWVIHCAALADLDTCEKNPELAQRINIKIPEKLAALVGRGGARLLHVSTDAVFDGKKGNYAEEDTPNPLSVYARSKLDAEFVVTNVNPEAIITRVNFFGFSPSGQRSLAEFFLINLQAGNPVNGFTDVFFCPLLVNDIAHIFFKLLDKELSGLYHVFSSECLSKHDFGVHIARQFELDETLITHSSVSDGNLKATRAPNLTMNTQRLATILGESMPTISPAIQRFYTLYQQGYPQRLKGIVRTSRD